MVLRQSHKFALYLEIQRIFQNGPSTFGHYQATSVTSNQDKKKISAGPANLSLSYRILVSATNVSVPYMDRSNVFISWLPVSLLVVMHIRRKIP